MAGIAASEVRVGLTARLFTADVGATPPADVSAPWDAAWFDLGYLVEDGLTRGTDTTTADIMAWQSNDPIRRMVTARTNTWATTLMQHSGEAVKLAFGGGTISESGTGDAKVYTYHPPQPGELDERTFGLEVNDGTIVSRFLMTRGMVSDVGDVPYRKDEATRYTITLTALGVGAGEDVWVEITNDAAFGNVASAAMAAARRNANAKAA